MEEEQGREEAKETLEDEGEFTTPMETDQLLKARTFYIYKNLEALEKAVAENHPICFIVVGKQRVPKSYAVYRLKKSKLLGWKTINFADGDGKSVCGLWYATLTIADTEVTAPCNYKEVAAIADLSAVAIPLKYCLGENHMIPHRAKCTVITQAWRVRTNLGQFQFPTIYSDLYQDF